MSNTEFAKKNREYNRKAKIRRYTSIGKGRSTIVTIIKQVIEKLTKYKNAEKQGLLNNIVRNGK